LHSDISGVYGTLVNIKHKATTDNLVPINYDYILVIDTEGLLSAEKGDEQNDKRLILFCLAVSHLVIVNVAGEINEPFKRMLLLCMQSLNYIGETRVTKPTVHFISNRNADPNKENYEKQVKAIREDLISHGLNNMIDLGSDNFHVLSAAFNRKPFSDPKGECAALSTDIKFVTSVQNLCKLFIDSSSNIVNGTGDLFSVPTNWIEFAQRVFQTLKSHPDLTFFNDIFERGQYEEVRKSIQVDIEEHLSPTFVRHLIQSDSDNSIDRIKESFQIEQNRKLKILQSCLDKYISNHAVSENLRVRSKYFLEIQVANLFRSWEVSAIMSAEQNKQQKIIKNLEKQLQDLAHSRIGRNHSVNNETAIKEFETLWKDRVSRIQDLDLETIWKQSIDLVFRLYDVLDKDALHSVDNVLSYIPFLKSLYTANQVIFMNESLVKIGAECKSKAAKICPFAPYATDTSNIIHPSELDKPHNFLDLAELKNKIFDETATHSRGKAISSKRNIGQVIFQEMNNNTLPIFRISYCFDKLIEGIKTILSSKISDEPSNGITLLQEVMGVVNKLIQDISLDFNVFNFSVSKSFQNALHTCAIISVALFYFNQHKTHFNEVLQLMHQKKIQLQNQFVRMVVPEENCDENIATNLVNEITEALCQSFALKVKEIIRNQLEEKSPKLNRTSIIKQVDNEVHSATDEWLMSYILHPLDIIIDRFNQLWTEIHMNMRPSLAMSMKEHLKILAEFFQVIQRINDVLQFKGANVLTFFDDLFELSSNDGNHDPSEKKICTATLLYEYFTGAASSTCITTKNGAIYTVNTKWQEVAGQFPDLREPLKDVFRPMKNMFETFNISYLSLFLKTMTSCEVQTENTFRNQMNELIETSCKSIQEQWLIRIRGCEAVCPCCKRLCDVDHRLDNVSPVGQGENRHRCQFGHQMRGMAGIKYEVTNEASIERCERIKDDYPIVTRQGIRQRWKEFKNTRADWDFDDSKTAEIHGARYVYIWKKIGQQLCHHFGNEMQFVEENSPSLINHFIFVIDHSSSMNSNGVVDWARRSVVASQPIRTIIDSNEKLNLSPWEHLLKALRAFICIRMEKVCPTDRMTIIIFGSRAVRVYDRVKLNEINIELIHTSAETCGKDTNFSLAFQMVIDTLAAIATEPMQKNLRQTIIFMTDGEPQNYPTAELERLSTSYKSMITNFWTMGLGKFNRTTLEKVNATMDGKFVDVDKPEDLPDTYAEIALFCDTNQP
jgi:uncharacterized protein YegL